MEVLDGGIHAGQCKLTHKVAQLGDAIGDDVVNRDVFSRVPIDFTLCINRHGVTVHALLI